MALTPLASVTDLPTARQGDADAARALDIASSAIRDAAGAAISELTSTVIVHAGRANLLGLPGPVTAVTSVTVDGSAVTDYETLPNGLWRHCGWGTTPRPVAITFTHGLAEVPADIVAMCSNLAVAWLDHQVAGGGSMAGLKSAKIDDASEAYTDEAAGQVSPVYIPEVTRKWLRARFGSGVEVVETL